MPMTISSRTAWRAALLLASMSFAPAFAATVAFENVRAFHKREMDSSWEMSRDGATVGDLPIEPGVEERIVELMLGAALSSLFA